MEVPDTGSSSESEKGKVNQFIPDVCLWLIMKYSHHPTDRGGLGREKVAFVDVTRLGFICFSVITSGLKG